MIILDDWTYINTCLCLCVCVPSVASKKMTVNLYWMCSSKALTEQRLAMSFPTIRYVLCQAVGSETKLHTHAILMPYATLWDTESDTLADCVGCWVWSLWVGWSAPSSGDDDFFPLCVLARSDLGSVRCSSENDQWDGFSMWDPNDVSQPTITRGAFQSKQGGCRLQGSCMNLRCEWRLNTWPSDLSYSCSHAWSFFAQLLPPQFLWSSLWSLLSLLEQSSSVWCKFEPILNPSTNQMFFSHLERHVGFCLHLVTWSLDTSGGTFPFCPPMSSSGLADGHRGAPKRRGGIDGWEKVQIPMMLGNSLACDHGIPWVP